jgi:hypothetical protein
MQGPHGAIVTAQDQDGIRLQREGEKVARIRDLAGMTGKHPARSPNGRQIHLVDSVLGEEFSRKRPAGRALSNEGSKRITHKRATTQHGAFDVRIQ